MKKSILIIGGAGRFGHRLAEAAAAKNLQVITFDSLVTGEASRVRHGPLVKADGREVSRLIRSLKEYSVEHVYHCALLQESASGPETAVLYDDHLTGVLSLIHALRESGTKAATVILEPTRTTEMIQRILTDCEAAYGLRLRLLSGCLDNEVLEHCHREWE